MESCAFRSVSMHAVLVSPHGACHAAHMLVPLLSSIADTVLSCGNYLANWAIWASIPPRPQVVRTPAEEKRTKASAVNTMHTQLCASSSMQTECAHVLLLLASYDSSQDVWAIPAEYLKPGYNSVSREAVLRCDAHAVVCFHLIARFRRTCLIVLCLVSFSSLGWFLEARLE